ncbi:MAG: glycosyltransferase [Lachnospiraceae bacterium]|nr:glycosyltransferase [Lachnospiraceae bacterium]
MDDHSTKKRVLQIVNYYYPELGGIEKIAQAISNAISDQYEEKIVCFTRGKEDSVDNVEGVEITRCGTKLKLFSQPLSISMAKNIKKLIKDFKPDIIILHLPNPFTEYYTLKHLSSSSKLIVYWHSDIVKQKIGEKIFRKLTVRLLDKATKIVATSPNYITDSYYLSQYKEKCVVIPNCIEEDKLVIDEDTRIESNKIREKNKDKIICVGVGRQVPYKGFEYLVQSMGLLPDKYVLYLIGREDESTAAIKRLSEGLTNVVLLGEIDGKALKAYLNACDIFCFSSITKNEAFGIALAEGMYYEKPAVTYTIEGSGVNYVNINNVTGIEVPNKDVKAYADAIIKLGEDKELRDKYGKAAKERVEKEFLSKYFYDNFRRFINNEMK